MTRLIAIVEDDDELRENYSDFLKQKGFDVKAFSEKAHAEEYFENGHPDLVILDISLGKDGEAGYDICSSLRRASDSLPIIFLTGLDGDDDKISGMRLGADDYISKSESIKYIYVRIEALLRRIDVIRSNSEKEEDVVLLGNLLINHSRYSVSWKNNPLDFTLAEYWMLKSMTDSPGRIRSSDELMDASNTSVARGTIAVRINNIRNKFKKIDKDFDCITNERGIGYRWCDDA